MAKTPQTKTKTVATAAARKKEPRKIKSNQYKSFKLQKPIRSDHPRLPGGFRLFKASIAILKQYWRPFAGIALIYGFLYMVLVQSFSNVNLEDSKATLEQAFAGQWGQVLSGISLFAFLVGKAGNANTEAAGAYQFILLLMASLAIIWTLRKAYAGVRVRARDGFYQGMYPVVPFLLVLAVVLLQALPFVLGSFLYSFAGAGGPVGGTELMLWGAAIFLLALLSLYMLCSSIFALYIVCLPDMTPVAALRSARELVRYRRWLVMRRLLFLPFILVVGGAIVMIPAIIFLTPIAIWIFFLLTLATLLVGHSYMYRLYRELL